jgi:hypothetical protein
VEAGAYSNGVSLLPTTTTRRFDDNRVSAIPRRTLNRCIGFR